MHSDAPQSTPAVYVFFGLVGAGKGTQVALFQEYLRKRNEPFLYLYPGSEFRNLSEHGLYVGSCIKRVTEQGELLPDFLTDTVVVGKGIHEFTGKEHIIFDGYPRSMGQATTLLSFIKFLKLSTVYLVSIDISEQTAIDRLMKRNRYDDSKEGIETRITIYKESVLPAVDHLERELGISTISINGEQSEQEVHQDIITQLTRNHTHG